MHYNEGDCSQKTLSFVVVVVFCLFVFAAYFVSMYFVR